MLARAYGGITPLFFAFEETTFAGIPESYVRVRIAQIQERALFFELPF